VSLGVWGGKKVEYHCSNLWVGEGLITPHSKINKKKDYYEVLHRAFNLTGSCEYGDEPSGSLKGREAASWSYLVS
jgi:hypothetical protein